MLYLAVFSILLFTSSVPRVKYIRKADRLTAIEKTKSMSSCIPIIASPLISFATNFFSNKVNDYSKSKMDEPASRQGAKPVALRHRLGEETFNG